MSEQNVVGIRNADTITFSLYLALVATGLLMVYTVTGQEMVEGVNFWSTTTGKQTIWVGASLLLFAFVQAVEWKFWSTFAYLIYGVSLVALVGVLIFGSTIKGATSWYTFGGFSIQPSEFAKFGACLAMAAHLSYYSTDLRRLRSQLLVLAILVPPVILIMLQPDAGSALTFVSFLVVLYRAGMSQSYYLVGFYLAALLILGFVFPPILIAQALILIGIVMLANYFRPQGYWLLGAVSLAGLAGYLYTVLEEGETGIVLLISLATFIGLAAVQWNRRQQRLVSLLTVALIVGSGVAAVASYGFNNVLKPHQQDRINVWLRPELTDPRGSRYNLLNSQMAISSGGLEGKGFLNGTMTKLNFVPEQSTDFIFCTVGEEQGFFGSVGVIGLFLLLLIRITIIAERQRSEFSKYYAYCVAGIFFVHVFTNIGMTMGLMPIIGIPLPFISKGGSSLLGFTLMLAVLLKLDSNRVRI